MVETVRVDDLLADLEIAPGDVRLVWMDVEGHELEALRGLAGTLRQAHPPLFFELTAEALNAAGMAEIADLVFGTYDEVFLYERGLRPIGRDEMTSRRRPSDILALSSR